ASVTYAVRKSRRRERRIGEPSHVGRVPSAIKTVATDKTVVKQQATEGGKPETERIQSRKGHVSSANHQGNQICAEAKQNRHGNEKNHRGPMHGEHAVENFR